MVKCIDNMSYDFSTFLYTTFVEQIDNAFYNSKYRKKYCDIISVGERNLMTLFGEVSFKRRYYHDNLKNMFNAFTTSIFYNLMVSAFLLINLLFYRSIINIIN